MNPLPVSQHLGPKPLINQFLTGDQCRTLAKLPGRNVWQDLCAPIAAVAPGGTLIYVNEAFSRLVGYPREWLVGDRPPYLFGPDYDVRRGSHIFSAGPLPWQINHCRHVRRFPLRHADGAEFFASILLESYFEGNVIVANIARLTYLGGVKAFEGIQEQSMFPFLPHNDVRSPEQALDSLFPGLTARLYDVMDWTIRGCVAKEVAEQLGLSVHTVRNHKKMIYTRLSINSNLALIMEYARRSKVEPAYDNLAGRETLSPREKQIVMHVLRGAEPKEVARELQVSINTLRNHLKSIYGKLNISNYAEILSRSIGLDKEPNA